MTPGSTPSSMRVRTDLADCQTMPKIAMVISRPTIGSASGKPSPHADRADDDGEAGEAIGAGMIAVRDQGRAVDLAADADAKHRDCFVAEKADDAGGGEPAKMRHRLRMDQPVDRLVARHDRAEQDDENDNDAGEVFDPAEPIGECPGRLAPRQHEGDPERDCSRCVADIVDRVGEQRHASRKSHDADLQQRRDRQDDERPFDRPDAAVGRGDRRIDDAVRVPMRAVIVTMLAMSVPVRSEAEPVEKAFRCAHRYFASCLSSLSAARGLAASVVSSRQCSI